MNKQLTRPDDGDRPERATPRKPVQVAISECVDGTSMVVVCSDGTLWRAEVWGKTKWKRLADIPQEDD